MCDKSADNNRHDQVSLSTKPRETASGVTNSQLLHMSKSSLKQYNKVYQDLMKWRLSKNIQTFNETVLLIYFKELSAKFKPTTVMTLYVILKRTLSINQNVDISKYSELLTFLRRNVKKYSMKKSKIFTPEEIKTFLNDAPDDEHLATKVALIFGIVGGCRRQELYCLKFKDVEVYKSKICVKVNGLSKLSHGANTYRIFTVTGSYFKLCKIYIRLRPTKCPIDRFFLQYKSGKCRPLGYGINHFGNMGKVIARFLNLPNPNMYTGNCFKRTSASIFVKTDGDISRHIISTHSDDEYQTTGNKDYRDCVNDSKINTTGRNSLKIGSEAQSIESEGEANYLIELNIKGPSMNNSNSNQNTSFEGYISESLDSKSEIWNEVQSSTRTNYKQSEHEVRQYSLENTSSKVVNINIPSTSVNSILPDDLSALLHFSNCKVSNVNVHYSK